MADPSFLDQYFVNPVQNAFTSLTKGTDISGLPYDAQAAALAKRQKMAELLMQQGQQQPEVMTYKGIAAQPSMAGGLGKALSQFMGAYMSGKAEEDAAKLEKTGNENFIKSVGNYYVDPGTSETKTPEANFSLGMPNIPKPVFDRNAGALVPGTDAGITPTNVNIPAFVSGSNTPSHTRTLDERMAYDLANMTGGNKAQSTHFATQYTADAAKSQAMTQLKPQVAAVMAQKDVPDTIISALTAGVTSEDPEAIKATLKEWLSKGTANAPSAIDAQHLSAFKSSNAARAAKGLPLESFDEYNNRMDVNKAVNIKAGEWNSVKREIDYRTQKQIESFHEKYDLPPEDMALVDAAVVDNRIDFSKLNSRTARYYAQLLKIDPKADLTSNAGVAALKKSPLFQQKVMVAATIPQMLTNLENITNKLNYNDIKAVGGIQNWWKQQNNDPTLAEYGPLRSDLILKITSAMRGVGMSDKATELENVVNSPTMSPQAIAGYVRGQMASIKPMLQEFAPVTAQTGAYENINGMNVTKGTQMPSSPAQNGAAAPGAGGGKTKTGVGFKILGP